MKGYKSNKWIAITQQLPPVGKRVELLYGLPSVRGAFCGEWTSEGWLLQSGIWSIMSATNVTGKSKPTHWREIPLPRFVLREFQLSDTEYIKQHLQSPVIKDDM